MDGLPKKTRTAYFIFLVLIFLVAAPLLGLYASGYRLDDDFSIIRTGGIYIGAPEAGARFFLDGEFIDVGSLLQRNFFVQDLTPGTYHVRIEKDKHHSWEKTVEVSPQRVVEGHAFLVLLEPERTPVLPYLSAAGAPTSSPSAETNPRFSELAVYFAPGSLDQRATSTLMRADTPGPSSSFARMSTTTVFSRGDIGIWQDASGIVRAAWLGEFDRTPYFFCPQTDACGSELVVYADTPVARYIAFAPDDNRFIILERADGIFMTELDTREPQNIRPVYPVPGAKVRVIDDDIVIEDGGALSLVAL